MSGFGRPTPASALVAVDEKSGELRLVRSLSASDIDRRFSLDVYVADLAPGTPLCLFLFLLFLLCACALLCTVQYSSRSSSRSSHSTYTVRSI